MGCQHVVKLSRCFLYNTPSFSIGFMKVAQHLLPDHYLKCNCSTRQVIDFETCTELRRMRLFIRVEFQALIETKHLIIKASLVHKIGRSLYLKFMTRHP